MAIEVPENTEPLPLLKTVAIIGSFKQHYKEVCKVWEAFTNAGLTVTSPKGAPILEEGIPFVRFASDAEEWEDHMVQTVALHRIFRANFVYVVAPTGYVGRTTCYEIGRILQAKRPIYFSEHPTDLPVRIPQQYVCKIEYLITLIKNGLFLPTELNSSLCDSASEAEADLLIGRYQKDNYFDENF